MGAPHSGRLGRWASVRELTRFHFNGAVALAETRGDAPARLGRPHQQPVAERGTCAATLSCQRPFIRNSAWLRSPQQGTSSRAGRTFKIRQHEPSAPCRIHTEPVRTAWRTKGCLERLAQAPGQLGRVELPGTRGLQSNRCQSSAAIGQAAAARRRKGPCTTKTLFHPHRWPGSPRPQAWPGPTTTDRPWATTARAIARSIAVFGDNGTLSCIGTIRSRLRARHRS
jgi:hypothetical protein